jgi:nitrogen fixation-related uncharacterized protein
MEVQDLGLNEQIFYYSTLLVPMVFFAILGWAIKSGQFKGDMESIKYIVLEDEDEEEDEEE